MKRYVYFVERNKSDSTQDKLTVFRVKKNQLFQVGERTERGYRDIDQAVCDIIQDGERWRGIRASDISERLKSSVRSIDNGRVQFASGMNMNFVAYRYREGEIEIRALN